MNKMQIVALIVFSLFITGCATSRKGEGSLISLLQEMADEESKISTNEDASSNSKTEKTFIYRHLVSVSDYYPSVEKIWKLCLETQGFKENLPESKVIMSREIRVPAKKREYTTQEVTKYTEKTITKKQFKYGIEVEPITETVRTPYQTTEEVEVWSSGTCIGSEYILSDR